MSDKLLFACINCSFGVIFASKKSIDKEVTEMMGEKIVTTGQKPLYSRFGKKAGFKKEAERGKIQVEIHLSCISFNI